METVYQTRTGRGRRRQYRVFAQQQALMVLDRVRSNGVTDAGADVNADIDPDTGTDVGPNDVAFQG